MNVVTVAYLAWVREVGAIVAGTDAADAALVPASDILETRIELAFDHLRIVGDAVERVRVAPFDPRTTVVSVMRNGSPLGLTHTREYTSPSPAGPRGCTFVQAPPRLRMPTI